MKNRFLAITFFIIGFFSSVHSQDYQNAQINNESILWEIRNDSLPFVSYLIGTNHFMASSLIDTSSVINDIINQTDVIVTELENSKIDSAELIKKIIMADDEIYLYPTEEDRKLVEDYIKKNLGNSGVRAKPMVYELYGEVIEYQKSVGRSLTVKHETVDEFFQNESIKRNKKNIGLETTSEQISILLDSVPIKNQMNQLIKFIKNIDHYRNAFKNVDSCYQKLILNCLVQQTSWEMADSIYTKTIVTDRNMKWMNKLTEMINNGPVLIAVGALHLTGPKGLIWLLIQKGYKLKPIKII